VRSLLLPLILIAILRTSSAEAQGAGGGTLTYHAWQPSARLVPDLVVGSSSVQVALPASPAALPVARVCNIGQDDAFVVFGAQSLVASTTTSQPVYPGQCLSFDTTNDTFMAAISDSLSVLGYTTLSVVQGYGNP
jgi:hypothetical protein